MNFEPFHKAPTRFHGGHMSGVTAAEAAAAGLGFLFSGGDERPSHVGHMWGRCVGRWLGPPAVEAALVGSGSGMSPSGLPSWGEPQAVPSELPRAARGRCQAPPAASPGGKPGWLGSVRFFLFLF